MLRYMWLKTNSCNINANDLCHIPAMRHKFLLLEYYLGGFGIHPQLSICCFLCRQKVVNHFVLLDQDDKGVELCDELKCYHCGNNPTHYCKDCDIHLCDTDLEVRMVIFYSFP